MLKIITNRKTSAATIPARVTTLSVSWMNHQFKAMAVHHGVVEGTWEYPGQLDDPAQFQAVLAEAVQKTSYRGQSVSVLLAHPRLVQQIVEVPSVKTAALRKILQRQAQQQKMFPGDAAWTSQNSLTVKGEQRILLHLLPKPLLSQLSHACKSTGLFLTSVVPPSAVLHQQIQYMGLEKGDVVLLAAETAGSTTVVVGRGDGQILLARTLPGTWKEDPERLALDLNRTVLFVSQQFGVTVSAGIRLFGLEVTDHIQKLQPFIQLPLTPAEVSPSDYDAFYWPTEVLRVRPALCPNFISPLLQQAPRRQTFAKLVLAATCLLVFGALAVAAYALAQARQEITNINTLTGQLKRLEARRLELQQRDLKLTRQEQTAKMVLDNRAPPVPLWFLGYLSEAVPSELVVTNLHIKHDGSVWKVEMAGSFQAAAKRPSPLALSGAVAQLSARLGDGPFHLRLLTDEEREQAAAAAGKPTGSGNGIAGWVANVASGVQARTAASASQFSLEGVMK